MINARPPTNNVQNPPVAPSFRQRISALWSRITCTDATAVFPRASSYTFSMRASNNSAHLLSERLAGLITNLQSPDVSVQRDATRALLNLSSNQDNRVALMGTPRLVARLITNLQSPDVWVQRYATQTLLKLATHQDNRVALRQTEGLVAGLTANLQGRDALVQRYATQTLLNLNALLNYAQNTHTASIHSSASANAKYLKAKFESTDLDEAYSNFCNWINNLPIGNPRIQDGYANLDFKQQIAKTWITSPVHLDHSDESSSVSVKGFLALFWTAANDGGIRETNVKERDARLAIIEALYEIRRGYNLDTSHNPKDDERESNNICAGGTFNKISEKMVSIITGTSCVTITPTVLITSITAAIQNEAKKRRESDSSMVDENSGCLTENGWDKIKDTVIAAIKNEYEAFPMIGDKSLDQHILEQTSYENVVQYLTIS